MQDVTVSMVASSQMLISSKHQNYQTKLKKKNAGRISLNKCYA